MENNRSDDVKKHKQDVDENRNIIQMKQNDYKLFCDNLCIRLQNKNAVVQYLLNAGIMNLKLVMI